MDLSGLTIQQLRYVVALDRHRSFREAARACHVSQPALSAQIKKVEAMLGGGASAGEVHLFDRSRQPVSTTEFGRAVVAHAQLILEQIGQLAEIARGTSAVAGSYRLGVLPTLATTMLPRLVPDFARAYPNVTLEIFEERTEVLVRRLRDGSLDGGIAVTPLDVPGLHERPICHEAFLVYLPPRHPLAAKERVRQAALVDERVWLLSEGHCFRNQALHLCSIDRRGAADTTSIAFDGGSFETLMSLVDAGLGVTIVPELLVHGLSSQRRAAQVRRFADPEPRREVSFLVAREHLRRPVADALVAVLEKGIARDLPRPRRKPNVVAPMPEGWARRRV